MELNTKLSIGGNTFVTDLDTALEIYKLISGKNVMIYSDYNNEILEPIGQYSLSITPLDKDFMDDVEAAKLVGETYSEYRRNKTH